MALEDLGVGAAPTGTTTTKTPIKVGTGYKATKTREVELDALGRVIVPDGAPIADPKKEVRRSEALKEVAQNVSGPVKLKTVPLTRAQGPGKNAPVSGFAINGQPATRSQKIDKDGKVVGYSYWVNGKYIGYTDGDSDKVIVDDPRQQTAKAPGLSTQTYSVDPKYFEGDQFRPASQPPEKIAELQRKMIEAGVLPKGYTTFGRWDDASTAAYEKILGYANAQGSTDDEIMDQWKKFGAADGPPAKKLVVKNPEEIAATVRAASAKILGRSLAQSEVDQLVAGYQQLDRTQQEKAFAADASVALGVDASSPEPISIDTYVANKVRSDHQGESQFMTGIDRMNTFYSMLGEAV